MQRKNAISAERANTLGAHAAEIENQLEWIKQKLRVLDPASAEYVACCLEDAKERASIIRNACYWEEYHDNEVR
jgi:hypothetical protein